MEEEEIIYMQPNNHSLNKTPSPSRNLDRNEQQLSVVKDQYSAEITFAEKGSSSNQTPLDKTPPLYTNESRKTSINKGPC